MNLHRLSKLFSASPDRASELLRCARDCRGWAPITAGYLGLREVAYPYPFRLRDGDSLTLERFEDLTTAWLVFIRRDYTVDPSSRVIIDAGANIGAFSLFASRVAPAARIIALEPFPSTFERLAETVRANERTERIVCRPWALGGADGQRLMSGLPMASQFRSLEGARR